MRVKDCMCFREIVQATPETNINRVAELMNTKHVGCIPICQEQQVVRICYR